MRDWKFWLTLAILVGVGLWYCIACAQPPALGVLCYVRGTGA